MKSRKQGTHTIRSKDSAKVLAYKARRKLSAGKSLTQIAVELGYKHGTGQSRVKRLLNLPKE